VAYRTDRASLSLSELRPPQQRADGSWLYDAIVTRAGVFEYELEGGGKRMEWRPPEEVSDPSSLETLQMAPVVSRKHTPKGEARKVHVGTVGQDVRWDAAGKYARASVVVRDDMALRDIASGMNEVSCGYEVDLDETPGVTPEGERYDAIQRGMPRQDGSRGPIVYEHLAIVPSGRQGPQVALRADSSAARAPRARSWRTDSAHQTTSARAPGGVSAIDNSAAQRRSKDTAMADEKKNGTRADCGDNMNKQDGPMPPPGGAAPPPAGPPMDPAKELEMLKAENAKLKDQLAKSAAAQDSAAAAPPAGSAVPRALDSADEDEDDMPPGLAQDSKARMDALVSARFELEKVRGVAEQLGLSVRADAKRTAIKTAIIEHLDGKIPQERLDSRDAKAKASYIKHRYDFVMERHAGALAAEKSARGGASLASVRQDGGPRIDAVSQAFLDQQKRNDARSQRGSK
jgi:hypothetical protein